MTKNSEDAYDPLRPHAHDPNLLPPSADSSFILTLPDGSERRITVHELAALPRTTVEGCFIVSTGHGTSGPFAFGGVALQDLIESFLGEQTGWSQAEVTSGDGFGTRIWARELIGPTPVIPILLGDTIDGRPMSRRQGLVRLIVPSERDDALRQVKWVARIDVRREP